MTGDGFFRTLQMIAGVALLIFCGLGICIWFICSEIFTEKEFRQRYGAEWRTEYENVHGSLAQARAKSVMCGVGFVALSGISTWLWRNLRGNPSATPSRRRHRHSHKSHLERIIMYRRNALLGIYFGLPGLFLGVLFAIFRWGIFRDHANEVVLGMFVFLGGYAGIIVGCAYWLKAKQLNEALVIIGLLPLAIECGVLFIPFVRLFLFADPLLLFVGMFMMSLILIVVVFTLPDKSGVGRGMGRRHSRHSNRDFENADSASSGRHDDGSVG